MSRTNGAEDGITDASDDHEESPGPEGGSGLAGSSNGSAFTLQSAQVIDNSFAGRIKRCITGLYKVSKSLIGLIIMLISFSFLGALVFMLLESPHEQKYKAEIIKTRALMVSHLLAASRNLSSHVTNLSQWEADTERLLFQYEADIMEAYQNNVKSASNETSWDFWSSLFFAGTVYTTIGYGHLAPASQWGRVACMIYAALGIPLALLVFADLGKVFTKLLKMLWAFVRRYYYTGYCRRIQKPFKRSKYDLNADEAELGHGTSERSLQRSEGSKSGSRTIYGYEVDGEFNLPITVAIAILLIYILCGSLMYSIWEDWGFLEAIYFVFISISTIGFGDVIPAHPKFFILSFVYIFIGLSLVSMCVNVAIEFFSETVTKAAKAKVDKAKKSIGKAKKKVTQVGKSAKDKMQEVGKNIKTNIVEEAAKRHRKCSNAFARQDRSHSATPISTGSASNADSKIVEDENPNGISPAEGQGVQEHTNNVQNSRRDGNNYDELKNV